MSGAERAAVRRVVALAPPSGRRVAAALACASLALIAGAALLATSGALISKAALRPPVLSLGVLIVSVRALALTRALARYGERLAVHDVALRSVMRLRSAVFARLAPRRPAGSRTAQAELLSRFVADVDRLQDLFPRALAPAFAAALAAAVTVSAAAVLLPAAGAVLLAGLLAAGVVVPAATARIARAASARQAAARAALTAEVLEVARHGAELAVLGQAPARAARIAGADTALARIARRDARARAAATAAGGIAQAATVVGTLLVAIPATHAGALDGILLAALVLLTLAAFEAVAPLPAAAVARDQCASAAVRVCALTEAPPVIADPRTAVELPADHTLALHAVTVRTPGGDRELLRGVDLRVRAGECVALTGPSGSGKTTLAELLVRFRDPDAGSVSLGGTDVRRFALGDLRGAVRLIAQDAGLFTTSIAENLRLARPDAGDDELLDALDTVGLGVWVRGLPAGIHTLLGEDGATVSGGQRRRIAVARALVADARVLVVDEPTAHLDAAGALQVLDALVDCARDTGATLIAIVHPGTDLARFDRVLELRDGVVTASPSRAGAVRM